MRTIALFGPLASMRRREQLKPEVERGSLALCGPQRKNRRRSYGSGGTHRRRSIREFPTMRQRRSGGNRCAGHLEGHPGCDLLRSTLLHGCHAGHSSCSCQSCSPFRRSLRRFQGIRASPINQKLRSVSGAAHHAGAGPCQLHVAPLFGSRHLGVTGLVRAGHPPPIFRYANTPPSMGPACISPPRLLSRRAPSHTNRMPARCPPL